MNWHSSLLLDHSELLLIHPYSVPIIPPRLAENSVRLWKNGRPRVERPSWTFSLRSMPAAGLRTQRQSLVPLATEERWLADPHSAMSAARFAHQEILTHRGARRVCFC